MRSDLSKFSCGPVSSEQVLEPPPSRYVPVLRQSRAAMGLPQQTLELTSVSFYFRGGPPSPFYSAQTHSNCHFII